MNKIRCLDHLIDSSELLKHLSSCPIYRISSGNDVGKDYLA